MAGSGNPFSLNFGIQPTEYIPRHVPTQEVLQSFSSDPSPSHVYMITGIRGSGKTVFLTEISEYLEKQGWLVFDLSIETDMLQSFAAKLYNEKRLRKLFLNAKLNFSYLGFGVEISGSNPITDLETAIRQMLEIATEKKLKILITIDEVVNSVHMRKFASIFQMLLRKRYQIYLLMTGLYENIYELQNEKTLTFLYRAPKIALTPLSIASVSRSYQNIFQCTAEDADEMGKLTMGYPYAYQVLGYLCWNQKQTSISDQVLASFDEYMGEYVYSKIWSEQSERKKTVLLAMAETDSDSVTEIRKKAGMETKEFSVYRSRLIRQGIIVSSSYGHLAFALPRFSEFVRYQSW